MAIFNSYFDIPRGYLSPIEGCATTQVHQVHLDLSHSELQRSCVAGPEAERCGEHHATRFRQLPSGNLTYIAIENCHL